MSLTYSATSTLQGAVQHLKYISGQDSLSNNDAARLINMAMDDYSSIAMLSGGDWKFDSNSTTTHPIATTPIVAGQNDYLLASSFLVVDRVEYTLGTDTTVLRQTDRRKHSQALGDVYGTGQTPSHFDYDGNTLFLYPTPQSGTVKVYFVRPLAQFNGTDGTVALGIPTIHQEYIPLKAMQKMGLRLSDGDYSRASNQLIEWEGQGNAGGKIRDFYSKRDQTEGLKLTPSNSVPKN
jgi:hypothetical protein